MADQATIPCPICGTALRFTVTTNRNGKHAIGVHCPQDGRHLRGFINHKPFVEDALTRMAEAEQERQATDRRDRRAGAGPPERFWRASGQAVDQEGTAGMIPVVLAVALLGLVTLPGGLRRWGT